MNLYLIYPKLIGIFNTDSEHPKIYTTGVLSRDLNVNANSIVLILDRHILFNIG